MFLLSLLDRGEMLSEDSEANCCHVGHKRLLSLFDSFTESRRATHGVAEDVPQLSVSAEALSRVSAV